MPIVNDAAFHAFHFLRKSNQDDVLNSLCPNAEDTEDIVVRQPPVLKDTI